MVASFPASLLSLVISSSLIRFPFLPSFPPFSISPFSLLSFSASLLLLLPFLLPLLLLSLFSLLSPFSFPPFPPSSCVMSFPLFLSPFFSFLFLFTVSFFLSSCFLLTQTTRIEKATYHFPLFSSLFLPEESTFNSPHFFTFSSSSFLLPSPLGIFSLFLRSEFLVFTNY